MVTQLQPDVRAYLHGGEVIKRYIRIEEVAHEYGFSVEETEYIATKDIMKKYVNATEGAIIYGISKSRIMVLAAEAGAVYKVGNSALINTDIFEMYLEKFKEPTRPLPKHIWNKLSSEDKKDHNSTCFDKKDP